MKKPSSKAIPSLTALIGLTLAAAPANAAITYVDAQEGPGGNTYATGGSLGDTSWIDTVNNTAGTDDANWVLRSTAPGGASVGWSEHNGSDVIQALVTSATTDTLSELTTEIPSLADGTYNVWVFFWEQTTSATQNWVIDAGLTSGSLASYSSAAGPVAGTDSISPVIASALTFSNAPSVLGAGGNQSMYGVNLGQVSVSGGSSIEIYVDKLLGDGSNNRTIFDGVGYERIPEPSSALLLALGGLGLLRRRRR